jgi:hypothetical protein
MENSSTQQCQHILQRLDESLRTLEKSLAGLAEKDWHKKPSPERWSIGEIVHHLVLFEVQRLQSLKDLLEGRRESAPPREGATPDILSYRRRETRVQAREEMQPTAGLPPKVLMAGFRRGRTETKAFVNTVELAMLQQIWFPTKSFGSLNGVEMLHFMAAHTERHAAQIIEARKQISHED